MRERDYLFLKKRRNFYFEEALDQKLVFFLFFVCDSDFLLQLLMKFLANVELREKQKFEKKYFCQKKILRKNFENFLH